MVTGSQDIDARIQEVPGPSQVNPGPVRDVLTIRHNQRQLLTIDDSRQADLDRTPPSLPYDIPHEEHSH